MGSNSFGFGFTARCVMSCRAESDARHPLPAISRLFIDNAKRGAVRFGKITLVDGQPTSMLAQPASGEQRRRCRAGQHEGWSSCALPRHLAPPSAAST